MLLGGENLNMTTVAIYAWIQPKSFETELVNRLYPCLWDKWKETGISFECEKESKLQLRMCNLLMDVAMVS